MTTTIAKNRSAFFEYKIEETLQAGLKLEGWEVKSLREGKANVKEAYVFIRDGEAFISGMQIVPLISASTHKATNPTRVRKLLLNKNEIEKMLGLVERSGYTLVPIELYWNRQFAKLKIGLGKGKKLHDKRETKKENDWKRTQSRILKQSVS
ncbi:SsrA-binding protein SmpB [Vibrio sp. D431a]|uniref:SsrA-binding protein SmpB n=1 Tax=Vibrio sp. D431a TaxID=2837388 RepID=UPI0025524232|nr:SsrA-binding protein SmpB [Vibrio sp. D431a]MDK9790713.1 SsrA-binding protein SmpB [Vibrio sp. D431a]